VVTLTRRTATRCSERLSRRFKKDCRDIFLGIKPRKRTPYEKDKRRTRHHWQMTLFYSDSEEFARVYTIQAKANAFAERQRKSPIVKMARVTKVS
jgi:hypothetical protein